MEITGLSTPLGTGLSTGIHDASECHLMALLTSLDPENHWSPTSRHRIVEYFIVQDYYIKTCKNKYAYCTCHYCTLVLGSDSEKAVPDAPQPSADTSDQQPAEPECAACQRVKQQIQVEATAPPGSLTRDSLLMIGRPMAMRFLIDDQESSGHQQHQQSVVSAPNQVTASVVTPKD